MNDTGRGSGVVVPGWQLLVRGQLSPFLFVFGIFFCLVLAQLALCDGFLHLLE